MTYHKDAVSIKRKSVQKTTTAIPCPVSGKTSEEYLRHVWIKSFLTQVMRREINKRYETFVSLTFLEVNLTSIPPKYCFQKNEIENSKRFSTVCFLTRRLCFEKIDTAASNREAVNNFFEI